MCQFQIINFSSHYIQHIIYIPIFYKIINQSAFTKINEFVIDQRYSFMDGVYSTKQIQCNSHIDYDEISIVAAEVTSSIVPSNVSPEVASILQIAGGWIIVVIFIKINFFLINRIPLNFSRLVIAKGFRNQIDCSNIHKQHRSHKAKTNTRVVIAVVLLIVCSLLVSSFQMRLLWSERTHHYSPLEVIPTKIFKEWMRFQFTDVVKANSLSWIEDKQPIHQILQLEADAHRSKLVLHEISEIRISSSTHEVDQHSQRPEIRGMRNLLSPILLRRYKRISLNRRNQIFFWMQLGQISKQRISILKYDDILIIDAPINDIQGMKIGETFDNPGNNKFNVVLKIISEEGEVGLIVVSCIKVQGIKVSQIEIQVEETIVLVITQCFYDEIRTMKTRHQVLYGQTSIVLKIANCLFRYLFDDAWHQTIIFCNKSCIEILRYIVMRNRIVSIHPFEFELVRLTILLFEDVHGV